MTDPKQPDVTSVIQALAGDGTLSQQQAAAVLKALQSSGALTGGGTLNGSPSTPAGAPAGTLGPDGADRRWTSLITEVGGYIGAIFVMAALVVFTGQYWDRLGVPSRAGLFAGPGVLLYAAAHLIAHSTPGGWTPVARPGYGSRHRLTAVLLLVAGGLMAGLVSVAMTRTNLSGEREVTLVLAAGFAAWAVGYVMCRSVVLQTAMIFSSAAALAAGLWGFAHPHGPQVAAWVIVLACLWAAVTSAGWLVEAEFAYLAAAMLGFVCAQILISEGDPTASREAWTLLGFVVLASMAAAGFVGYLKTRMLGVLTIGVICLAVVVPQSVLHYTNGALGAAGALLLSGLSIVGASLLGLRVRREAPGTSA